MFIDLIWYLLPQFKFNDENPQRIINSLICATYELSEVFIDASQVNLAWELWSPIYLFLCSHSSIIAFEH